TLAFAVADVDAFAFRDAFAFTDAFALADAFAFALSAFAFTLCGWGARAARGGRDDEDDGGDGDGAGERAVHAPIVAGARAPSKPAEPAKRGVTNPGGRRRRRRIAIATGHAHRRRPLRPRQLQRSPQRVAGLQAPARREAARVHDRSQHRSVEEDVRRQRDDPL